MEITRLRDTVTVVEPGSPTLIDTRPVRGTWVNYDEQSEGITQVAVRGWDDTLLVRLASSGTTWPEVPAAAFGAGVDQHEAVGFAARYELDFATILIAAYLNKRLLVVDAYTAFTDASGRSDYFQRDHLYLPQPPVSSDVTI